MPIFTNVSRLETIV